MAIFLYKGIDSTGKELKSTINADSAIMAKQKLSSLGIMLMELSEQSTEKNNRANFTFGTGVNINDLSLMTRQLATLIKAKIPLAEAISALVDQVDNQNLKIVLAEVKQKINEGSSLAASLKDYPQIFDAVYNNMVEAGEASGNLDLVLLRLAEFTESRLKLKNKISSSMMYPMIMACAGLLMMIFIFTVIIPKLSKLFTSMRREIPLPTQICLAISQFLQDYWFLLLILIPISVVAFKRYLKSPSGEAKWHALQLKLPIVGELIMMINVSRFCSTLATLLNSGVPILMALKIVKNIVTNVHMQRAIEEAKDQVGEGLSITGPLIQSGFFPPLVTHMIKLGEKSGELEEMLQIVAENYGNQVDSKLEGLTSIIEPIMMVFLGLVVAFIVISIIMPIMELNSLKK